MRTTSITAPPSQPTTAPDAWTATPPLRAMPLPARLALALLVALLMVLAVVQASARLQAGTVHDPIRVEQVQAALIAAGWDVAADTTETQHPALALPGTRLDLPGNGSTIDVYLFGSTAERVDAEQQVVLWNRTMLRVGGDDGNAAVRITSVENALFIIVGDDLATVDALNSVVAGLARS